MSTGETTRSVIGGLLAGSIGGVVGVAVASWLADNNKILGASWWDGMTAFGTVGAVGFAMWLAVREMRIGIKKRKETAKISAILLWPVLRKYLSAISILQKEHYLDSETCVPPDLAKAKRSLSYLESGYEEALALVQDLNEDQRALGLYLLAHTTHAFRHLTELLDELKYVSSKRYDEKLYAARESLKDARAGIVPLIRHCKEVMDARVKQ